MSELITNKSHTAFRLVLTTMTLNDLKRRDSFYFALAYLTEFDCFGRRLRQRGIDLKCLRMSSST